MGEGTIAKSEIRVINMLKSEKRGSPAFHRFLDSLGPPSLPVAI
jgi:hypothetical protein